jgi:hypothetical protein
MLNIKIITFWIFSYISLCIGKLTDDFRNYLFNSSIINDITNSSTKTFVLSLLNSTDANPNDKCLADLENNLKNIFQFSFSFGNNLGDYNGCINQPNMKYLFILFIDPEYKNAYDPTLACYFKNLIFNYYSSFSLCVPKCVEIPDKVVLSTNKLKTCLPQKFNSIKINTKLNTTSILMRVHDLGNLNEENNTKFKQEFIISFTILIFIYSTFFLLSIFFGLFPSLVDLYTCFCCRTKNKKGVKTKSFKIKSNPSDDSINKSGTESGDSFIDNNTTNQQDKSFKKSEIRYKTISSIFSISKNVKRIFKATNKKNNTSIHSNYINDNSLAFINGIRGLNLFIMTICVITWIIIQSPISNINIIKLQNDVLGNGFFLPSLYYFYCSIYWNFSSSGFLLSYKFLSHLCEQQESEKPSKWKFTKKVFSFLFPQLYRYVLYLILFLMVYNLEVVLSFLFQKDHGPLMYIYSQISQSAMSFILYFIFPSASFLVKDTGITKNAVFIWFFMFIDELYYFLISIMILILYKFKPKIGIWVFIIGFFAAISSRTAIFMSGPRDMRDIFGYEISFYQLHTGISVYFIGCIFGILYFEYNFESAAVENSDVLSLEETYYKIDVSLREGKRNESSLISSGNHVGVVSCHRDEMRREKANISLNPSKDYIKDIAKSNISQNFLIVIGFIFFGFFISYDLFVFIANIQKDPLYQFSTFEKFYAFLELDIFVIFSYFLIFKFVIFNQSSLKNFLESNFWIPFSRSFVPAIAQMSPVAYFIVLTKENPKT